MATEQDWPLYTNQAFLAGGDTILARTSAGGGVEVAGIHVASRRDESGPYVADGRLIGAFGALSTVQGVADWNDISNAIPGSGIRLLNTGAANHPPQNGFFHPFSFEYTSKTGVGNLTQFAIPYVSNLGMFFRTRISGVWDNWQQILCSNLTSQFNPGTDNISSMGSAGRRFTTIFSATGTINTSDERDKDWRGTMSDKEYAAAMEVIDELGFYQWKDAVAEKGDDARLHFGARAQRVFAIMDKHLGKDAWRKYGFACHDVWDAEYDQAILESGEPDPAAAKVEVVPAGDRYGLRESQLTLFLVSAQARQNAEMKTAIAALQKKVAAA